MRRRITAYFGDRRAALRAADAVRPLAASRSDVKIVDAGLADDLDLFTRIGLGLIRGGGAGVVLGVAAGLVLKVWDGSAWGPVLAMCAIALSAFGALAGGMFGSAAAGAREQEADEVAVTARLPAGQARAAEERIARVRRALD